jgi:phosphoserine aminotransferase
MTVNFNAGPAGLPKEVMERAHAEFLDYNGTGISIMEASHRSPDFQAVINGAESSLRQLLNISDDYHVLFLQGGASTQFAMIPMNLCGDGQVGDYIDSGAWSAKALKEAVNLGLGNCVASSKESTYSYIPEELDWQLSDNAAYLHITSNNTIYGTQFHAFPNSAAPLIADMSSDILSRKLDVNQFGMIYCGAQKNIGPSGVTLVIIRKDLLERCPDSLPSMFKYTTHSNAGSMFNTPPTFAIYMIKLVGEWLLEKGGIESMEHYNNEKAAMLYDEIDADGFYTGSAAFSSRSLMNVHFNLPSPELEAQFVSESKAAGMIGLKGHRSIGGVRASIYNAQTKEGITQLTSFMQSFRTTNG